MTLDRKQWPEDLPPASPPPGDGARRAGASPLVQPDRDDPGHLMTDEEWREVQQLAGEADHAG